MKFLFNRIVFLLSICYFVCFYSCAPPQTQPASQPASQPAPKISAKLVAGEGEKKVITSGYGKNPDEALTQALRNAVEEAVGTYMTSTTRIENDELIEDKVLSLSRGFIKDFKKLSEMRVEDEIKVTVSAIVTGSQILETLKASGVKIKVAGQKMFQQFASFDRQMEDEYKVISNLLKDLPKEGPLDYTVEVSGEPIRKKEMYYLTVKVTGKINENYKRQYENLKNILEETALETKLYNGKFETYWPNNWTDRRTLAGNQLQYQSRTGLNSRQINQQKHTLSAAEVEILKDRYGRDLPHLTGKRINPPGWGFTTKGEQEATGTESEYYDLFDKPYSPFVIGLVKGYQDLTMGDGPAPRDRSTSSGNTGQMEEAEIVFFKYLNKKSFSEISGFIKDYFYDIGFRIKLVSSKTLNKDIRNYEISEQARRQRATQRNKYERPGFERRAHIDFGTPKDGFNDFKLAFLSLVTDYNSYSQSKGINGYSVQDGKYSSISFAGWYNSAFLFPDRLYDHKLMLQSTSTSAKSKAFCLLLAPNIYHLDFQHRHWSYKERGDNTREKKINGSGIFFQQEYNLIIPPEVFANLESIEIEPLPVRKDF